MFETVAVAAPSGGLLEPTRQGELRSAEERLVRCAGVVNRAMADLVVVVAEALRDETWQGAGYISPNHWLRMKAGLSSSRASQVLAVARRYDELPETLALFARGALTLEQVLVVATHVPSAYEASVAEMAPFATVDQLRRATKDYTFIEEADQRSPGDGARAGSEVTVDEPAGGPVVDDVRTRGHAGEDPCPRDLVVNAAENAVEGSAPSVCADAGLADDGLTRATVATSVASSDVAESSEVMAVDADGVLPSPRSKDHEVEFRAPVGEVDEPATLSMQYTDRGRFRLRYEGPASEGALIEQAVREVKDALWRHLNHEPTDRRSNGRQVVDESGRSFGLDADHRSENRETRAREAAGGRPARRDTADSGAVGRATASCDADGHAECCGAECCGVVGGDVGDCRAAGRDVDDAGDAAMRFPGVQAGEGGPVGLARAFVALATQSLASIGSPSRRDRYRVYVHLDTEGGRLTGRPRLPRHVVEALTCDGVLQPVWRTQGRPVNVGRAHRIVPDRTRRLIEDRDRGCRFPGCGSTFGVEAHHIRHWQHGGRTDTPELLSLCSAHHDAYHRGEFTISGDADAPEGSRTAVVFRDPSGGRIGYRAPRANDTLAAHRGVVAAATRSDGHSVYRPPTGERLHTHWVSFSRRPIRPPSPDTDIAAVAVADLHPGERDVSDAEATDRH